MDMGTVPPASRLELSEGQGNASAIRLEVPMLGSQVIALRHRGVSLHCVPPPSLHPCHGCCSKTDRREGHKDGPREQH